MIRSAIALLAGCAVVIGPPQHAQGADDAGRPPAVPVLWRGDVVVVGGSTGAVAAATTAAKAGDRVFLVEPFPYLGEDMTATLRLWLEPDERADSALAHTIFHPRQTPDLPGFADRLPFTYRADRPPADRHKDSAPPTCLNDGRWGSARIESVQYDGDPTVTVKLTQIESVCKVYVLVYHANDFQVAGVEVRWSSDDRTWSGPVEIENRAPEQRTVDETALALSGTFPENTIAKTLQVRVRRAPGCGRVLLGEIVVVGAKRREAVARPRPMPTPAWIKQVLISALIDNDVEFLLSAIPTDAIVDERGAVRGVVFETRGGRRAVIGKVVVDATDRAQFARLAGAKVRPFTPGAFEFQRVVIGGAAKSGNGLSVRRIDPPFSGRARQTDKGILTKFPLFAYTLQLPLRNDSEAAFQEAEQTARDRTFHPQQETASDVLFQVPPDPIRCEARYTGAWHGVEALPVATARVHGVSGLFILGGCIDVSRENAARLLRPPALIRFGERIGHAVVNAARALPAPGKCRFRPRPENPAPNVAGEFRRTTGRLRPGSTIYRLHAPIVSPPVLGRYDVVVIGGGTAGAPAGIAAARHGARTLVIEMLHGLGGVGTLGAITKYYWGYRGGFTAEVPGGASRRASQRREWWRETLRKAGANVWFGVMGVGALVEDGRVRGVIAASPHGLGLVLAKVVIDATGSADIAAAAGAPCALVGKDALAAQGTGLPPLRLGADYINTDFTVADETDPVDLRRIAVQATFMANRAFDVGSLVDSRERRRIVGEYVLSPVDQVLGRVFPDTVAQAWSDFDSHGYTVHPLFYLQAPDTHRGIHTWIPYRCLLPKGLDGILVVGLGISAHRDALPGIRMQPDVQNVGYAAGTAAAMVALEDGHTRRIDLDRLQQEMVKIGILPKGFHAPKTVTAMDRTALAAAVSNGLVDLESTARVLAMPEKARPLLRHALFESSTPEQRLRYAIVLALLGDGSGVPELVRAAEKAKTLDKGWNYRSGGQYGRSISPLDQIILALGWSGDRRAVTPILRLAKLLTSQSTFSHFRCIAMALERLHPSTAAPVLITLLDLPGVRGHALRRLRGVQELADGTSFGAVGPRREALREMFLARALVHCGDPTGLGRTILEGYVHDFRACFARHAGSVLAAVPPKNENRRPVPTQ